MALDKWKPKAAEKAKGYFVVKDFKDKDGKQVRRYGSVFFAKEEDVVKHCTMLNEIAEAKHLERMKENRKERRNRKWQNSRPSESPTN